MIHLKENPIGIDAVINRYMQKLNGILVKRGWNLDIYHRVYKELSEDGKPVPYVFVGGTEYREVFLNDGVAGEVGFLISEDRSFREFVSVDCDVIFSVNLEKLDGGSMQREDEKVLMIALSATEDCEQVSSIKTGIDNVFSSFDTDRIKYRDMQPFFNFSFRININYKNNKCYGV